jgi:hypothetical protein
MPKSLEASLIPVPDTAGELGEVGVPLGVVLVGDGWPDDTDAGASAPDSLPQPANTSPQAVTITIVRITTNSQDTSIFRRYCRNRLTGGPRHRSVSGCLGPTLQYCARIVPRSFTLQMYTHMLPQALRFPYG